MSTYAARTIPAGIRRNVIARDGMRCRRCGVRVFHLIRGEAYDPQTLHLDHVIPWAAGGQNTEDNLIVTCSDCNLRRAKPEKIVRQSRIKVEKRDGTYWWPDGYVPPRVSAKSTRALKSVQWVAEACGISDAQVLVLIADGHLAASASSPVKVEMPKAERAPQPPKPPRTIPAWLERERAKGAT